MVCGPVSCLQELNAAATKIQAVQKGRVARAEVETMKKEKEGPAEAGEGQEEPGEELPDLNDPVRHELECTLSIAKKWEHSLGRPCVLLTLTCCIQREGMAGLLPRGPAQLGL